MVVFFERIFLVLSFVDLFFATFTIYLSPLHFSPFTTSFWVLFLYALCGLLEVIFGSNLCGATIWIVAISLSLDLSTIVASCFGKNRVFSLLFFNLYSWFLISCINLVIYLCLIWCFARLILTNYYQSLCCLLWK